MGCCASDEGDRAEMRRDPVGFLKKKIEESRAEIERLTEEEFQAKAEYRWNINAQKKTERIVSMMKNDVAILESLAGDLNRHIAETDAFDMREASVGFGTDEEKMMKTVVGRLPETLRITDEIYQKKYNKTLEKQIKGENKTMLGMLTGKVSKFGQFLVFRVQEQPMRDATIFKRAMSGFGCSDYMLVEVLATRTNDELRAAAAAYEEAFGKNLVETIQAETGGFGAKWYGIMVDTKK